MRLHLKHLSLLVAGALIISAVPAAVASANYTSTVETTHIHGTQTTNHVFKTNVGTITCKKATYTEFFQNGSKVETGKYTVTWQTVTPEYKECTAFGFSAEFRTNGCKYQFNPPSLGQASTTIWCSGFSMEVVVAGFCTMTIGSQLPEGKVTFTNEGSGSTAQVKASFALSKISYGGSCGSGTNGTYEGTSVIKGYTSSAMTTQVGISVM